MMTSLSINCNMSPPDWPSIQEGNGVAVTERSDVATSRHGAEREEKKRKIKMKKRKIKNKIKIKAKQIQKKTKKVDKEIKRRKISYITK